MDYQALYDKTSRLESQLQDAISALQEIAETLQNWNVELERILEEQE